MSTGAGLRRSGIGRDKALTTMVVVLDFDGVVVDSMPLQERAWREAARSAPKCEEPEDAIVRNLYTGKAREKMFDGLELSKEKKRLLRAKKDELWFRLRRTVPLMPGARKIIPLLARRYRVAIATTADRAYVENVLSRERLDRYISHVITDADVSRPKPAPDMLEALAIRFGIGVSKLYLVGDTDSDQDMSRAAGCTFIRFGLCEGAASPRAQTVAESWRHLGQLLAVVPSDRSSPIG